LHTALHRNVTNAGAGAMLGARLMVATHTVRLLVFVNIL